VSQTNSQIHAAPEENETPRSGASDAWVFDAVKNDDGATLRARGGSFHPDVRDGNGEAPLHVAAWEGKLGAARALLDGGAPVDSLVESGTWKGCTPLLLAIERGHTCMAELLLERGARAEAPAGHALQKLLYGPALVPELLLDAGRWLDAFHHKETPHVNYAADPVLRVVEALAVRSEPFSDALLADIHMAVRIGHLSCAECGLREGRLAWFDEALSSGTLGTEELDALVGIAAGEGLLAPLEKLAAYGAPISEADSAPLRAALLGRHGAVARWLLDHGAAVDGAGFIETLDDPDLGDRRVATSTLGLAARLGDAELVATLLGYGCDPSGDDVEPEESWIYLRPLALASTPDAIAALLAAGARLDEQAVAAILYWDRAELAAAATDGATPELLEMLLLRALEGQRPRSAEAFVRAGSPLDVVVVTEEGELSPLEVAIQLGDAALVQAIVERRRPRAVPKVLGPLPPDVRAVLLEHGVPLPRLDDLFHAVTLGTADDVKAVLARGAEPRSWDHPDPRMARSSPIIGAIAMRTDEPEIALALLEAGGDAARALVASVMEGQLAVARAARARGASLTATTDGMSLLQLAARDGRTAVAEWLLDQGVEMEPAIALFALAGGHIETATWLLGRGAAPRPVLDALRPAEWPAEVCEPAARLLATLYEKLGGRAAEVAAWQKVVVLASSLGDAALLRSLARGGSLADAALGLTEIARERPLHAAIAGGHQEAVAVLLELGADPSGKLLVALRGERQPGDLVVDAVAGGLSEALGEVPPGYAAVPALHYAAVGGQRTIIDLLLAAGADWEAVDSRGRQAGEIAPTRTLRDALRAF
jgi:ankyrin repeat protein